jgi:hypothetical protein
MTLSPPPTQIAEVRHFATHCVKAAFNADTGKLRPEFACEGHSLSTFKTALKGF